MGGLWSMTQVLPGYLLLIYSKQIPYAMGSIGFCKILFKFQTRSTSDISFHIIISTKTDYFSKTFINKTKTI